MGERTQELLALFESKGFAEAIVEELELKDREKRTSGGRYRRLDEIAPDLKIWKEIESQLSDRDLAILITSPCLPASFTETHGENCVVEIARFALNTLKERSDPMEDPPTPNTTEEETKDKKKKKKLRWFGRKKEKKEKETENNLEKEKEEEQRKKREKEKEAQKKAVVVTESAGVLFEVLTEMLTKTQEDAILPSAWVINAANPNSWNSQQRKKVAAIAIHNNYESLVHLSPLFSEKKTKKKKRKNACFTLTQLALWQSYPGGRAPNQRALSRLVKRHFSEEALAVMNAWTRGPLYHSRFCAQWNLPPTLRDNSGDSQAQQPQKLGENVLEPTSLGEVFSFLDPRSLALAGQVCKAWHTLSVNDALWARHIQQTMSLEYQCCYVTYTEEEQLSITRHRAKRVKSAVRQALEAGREGKQSETHAENNEDENEDDKSTTGPRSLKEVFMSMCKNDYVEKSFCAAIAHQMREVLSSTPPFPSPLSFSHLFLYFFFTYLGGIRLDHESASQELPS